MKVITFNNLKEILNLMKPMFGERSLADKHRNALNTYILNINYADIDKDTSFAILGMGQLGTMVLGKTHRKG